MTTMTVSTNSREALQTITRDGRREDRHDEIRAALLAMGSGTAKEIANYLGQHDPNYVRPRLTEGKHTTYEVCGQKYDPQAKATASIYRLRAEQPRKPFCNCTFAGQLKPGTYNKMPALFCHSEIHPAPLYYGRIHA